MKDVILKIILTLFVCLYLSFYSELNIILNIVISLGVIVASIFTKLEFNKNKLLLFLSLFISFCLCTGEIVYNYSNVSYLHMLFTIGYLIKFIFFGYIIFLILKYSTELILKVNVTTDKKQKSLLLVMIFSSIILISFLFLYFVFYPGITTSDSELVFVFYIDGYTVLSDWQPTLWWYSQSLIFNFGRFISSNDNIAMSLVVLFQVFFATAVYVYSLVFLHSKNVKVKFLVVIALFYAVVPIYGFTTISLNKDIIFSSLVLLLIIRSIKLKENFNIKNMIIFSIISLLTILFRYNGIFAYTFMMLCFLYFFNDKRKYIILMFSFVVLFYIVIKGPVYSSFNIEPSPIKESIAIPIQQVARMLYLDDDINDKYLKLINDTIKVEHIVKQYDPFLSDEIRHTDSFNDSYIEDSKYDYLNMYINLLLDNPVTALEAHLSSTLGYYYPHADLQTLPIKTLSLYVDVERDSIFPEVDEHITHMIKNNQPTRYFYSMAVWFFALLICMYVCFKKNMSHLYVYLFLLGLVATIFIGTPSSYEFRYIFPLCVSLPILLFYTLSLDNKDGVK